jgi:AAA-like domain
MKNIFKLNREKVKQIELQNSETQEFESKYPIAKLYSQNGVQFEADHAKLSNRYSKTYYLTDLPKYLVTKDVAEVFQLNKDNMLDFDFDFHVKLMIRNDNAVLTKSKMEMAKSVISVETQQLKMFKKSDTLAKSETAEIESIEEKLSDGQEMNDIVFVLTVFADSEDRLRLVDNQVQSRLKNKKWYFSAPYGDQKNALTNSLPVPVVNGHELKVLSEPLSMLLLPTNTRLSGVLPIGYDCNRNNIYLFDIFKDGRAWTITITGKNGSGKSAFAKVLFEILALLGVQRFFIDPEGETLAVAETVGATVHYANIQKGVNPVYFDEDIVKYYDEEDKKNFDPQNDQILFLTEFCLKFPIVSKELKENRTPMYNAFRDFYNGVGKDKANRNMIELVKFIQKNNDKYSDLYLVMSNFGINGVYHKYVSSTDEFGLEEDAVVFVTKGIKNEGIRSALGAAILLKVWDKMLRGGKYRALFIDELLMYIKDPYFRDLIIQFISRGRKYNAFFILLTQELNHYKQNEALSILEQSGFDFIFKHKTIDEDVINLTTAQISEIQALPTGTCFVHTLGASHLEKVSLHMRDYQLKYIAKKGTSKMSTNLFERYEDEGKSLSEILK